MILRWIVLISVVYLKYLKLFLIGIIYRDVNEFTVLIVWELIGYLVNYF